MAVEVAFMPTVDAEVVVDVVVRGAIIVVKASSVSGVAERKFAPGAQSSGNDSKKHMTVRAIDTNRSRHASSCRSCLRAYLATMKLRCACVVAGIVEGFSESRMLVM